MNTECPEEANGAVIAAARDRPQAVHLSNDVPSYRTHTGKFIWKLLSARIAMLLGR